MASLSDIVFFLAFLQVAYLVSLFIARLYFSPIARFPGPRLAAVSYFYEFYYDFICRGQYEFKIEYLHEKYGPVIRINPGELHVSDPDFYSQVFVSSSVRKSSRPVSHRNAAPSRESTNTTLDHDHHHRRRKALDPYFSRAMVTKLEPEIQTLVQRMHERLWTFRGSGKPVNLFEVFSALAADVITGYCFGTRWDSLEKEDFNADIAHVHNSYTKLMPLFRLFPTLLDLSLGIPEWMITDPGVAEMQKHKHRIEKQVQDTRTSTTTAQKPVKATENGDRFHHSTIFDELLERSSLPPSELTDQRLTDEAITLVGAGLVTTAHTLAFISFYLLNQPGTLAKLRLALEPLMARYPAVKPSWTQLEAVPYLNAVVTETLRMHGVLRRNARIFPEDDVRCGEWTIPAGVRATQPGLVPPTLDAKH